MFCPVGFAFTGSHQSDLVILVALCDVDAHFECACSHEMWAAALFLPKVHCYQWCRFFFLALVRLLGHVDDVLALYFCAISSGIFHLCGTVVCAIATTSQAWAE